MPKQKILVIDDEEPIRNMLRQILEKEGFEVVDAREGEEGLKCQRAAPADLIITDIIMPEKEGIETIRELKEDYPELKILAISGGGRIGAESYLALAEKFGADAILRKPLTRDELMEKVRSLL